MSWRDRAAAKLMGCVASIEDAEAAQDLDDERGNRGIWRRLAAEARGDARYWALELWLAGAEGS